MKQWIKHIAVMLSFVMMANSVLNSAGMKVWASDVATISGNETGEEGGVGEGTAGEEGGNEMPGEGNGEGGTTGEENGGDENNGNETVFWSVTVQYELDGGEDATGAFAERVYTPGEITGGFEDVIYIQIPEEEPTHEEYAFGGWSCNFSALDEGCEPGREFYVTREEYAGKTIVFTAHWEEDDTDLAQVTIMYERYDGNNEQQVIKQENENQTTFDLEVIGRAVEREYYKFGGWRCDIDYSIYSIGQVLENLNWDEYAGTTIDFTPVWKPLPIATVNFERRDGEVITQTIQQKYETDASFKVNLPVDDSQEDGYTFTGWYSSDYYTFYNIDLEYINFPWEDWADKTMNFTTVISTLPTPTFDCRVIFETGGGTDISSVSVLGGQCVEEPEIPTKEGYIFMGWYLNETIYDFNTPVTEEITLIARWEPLVNVTVNYINENGIITDTNTIQKPGESATSFMINLPEEKPVREGYKFNGWLCSADNRIYAPGSVVENLTWNIYGGGTITFTAEWTELPKVTVIFERRDGEVITDTIRQSKETDTTFDVVLPVDDSQEDGFTFTGWYCSSVGIIYGPNGQTLTLSWDEFKNRTITFIPEGESTYFENQGTPDNWDRLIAGPNNGNGHFSSLNNTPEAYVLSNIADRTNENFFAHLKIMSAPEVSRVRMVMKYIDDNHWGYLSLDPNDNYYKWGYEYQQGDVKGWKELTELPEIHQYDEFSVKFMPGITTATNTVAYIHLIVNNRTTNKTGMVIINDSDFISLGDHPGKVGFGAGYYAAPDGGSEITDICFANVWSGSKKIQDYSYYQNLEGQIFTTITNAELEKEIAGDSGETEPEKEYTVSFDTVGGSEVASIIVKQSECIAKPENPIKEGFSFSGWILDGQEYDFTTVVTADITLTAVWEVNYYAVIFEDGEGNEVSSVTVEHNDCITEPDCPTKEGYEFLGWYLEDEVYNFDTKVTSSLVLIARWKQVEYVITFDSEGGTTIASQVVKYGERITKPEDPIKEGYIFKGWYVDGETYDFSICAMSNLILTALWEVVETPKPAGDIVAGEEIALATGVRYSLGEGSWTVNGEGYTYSGNNNFYVTQSGSYTFTLKE